MIDHRHRFYRDLLKQDHLVGFRVVVKETDLFIHASENLTPVAKDLILTYRHHIEDYIEQHPTFHSSLEPWPLVEPAPDIVKEMVQAGVTADVGPMAAVAGAIAGRVGTDLLQYTPEVIVENGGDIFLKVQKPITVGVFAGVSPLSLKVGLQIDDIDDPFAICTSSGTVGHSLSMGNADAVCVMADSGALADAIATAAGNRVHSKKEINTAVDFGSTVSGVKGMAVVVADQIGVWGQWQLVPLSNKKG